jgi:hypothetical protein
MTAAIVADWRTVPLRVQGCAVWPGIRSRAARAADDAVARNSRLD